MFRVPTSKSTHVQHTNNSFNTPPQAPPQALACDSLRPKHEKWAAIQLRQPGLGKQETETDPMKETGLPYLVWARLSTLANSQLKISSSETAELLLDQAVY